MTNETTTIQVTQDQREYLRSVNSGSAKAALQDLIDDHADRPFCVDDELMTRIEHALEETNTSGLDANALARELSDALASDLKATLPGAVAEKVEERLR